MSRFRSAQRQRADDLSFFGPLRPAPRPLPVASLVIAAVLLIATVIAVAAHIGAHS